MQFTVCDIAAKLHVTEEDVIHRMEAEELPAYKNQDQYCIRRSEFLEWASFREMNVPADAPQKKKDELVCADGRCLLRRIGERR